MRSQVTKKIFNVQNKINQGKRLSLVESGIYFLLNIMAGLYYFGNYAKWFLYEHGFFNSKKAEFKVISIGNIKIGGTGKSPLAIKTAACFINSEIECAVINRGYMGPATGLNIISDGREILKKINECSDEAYMEALALIGRDDTQKDFCKPAGIFMESDKFTPLGENKIKRPQGAVVLTSKQRVDSIDYLEKIGFKGIALLDDAFQYYRLKRDLNIVILDYADPFGGFKTFPAGMLRDRPGHLIDADIIVVSKCSLDKIEKKEIGDDAGIKKIRKIAAFYGFKGKFFYSAIKMTGLYSLNKNQSVDFSECRNLKFFMFSALADNSGFFKAFAGAVSKYSTVFSSIGFLDHFNYSSDNQKMILEKASQSGSDIIVTTFKDAVKLDREIFKNSKIYAAQFEIVLNDEEKFFEEVKCLINLK